MKRISIKYSVFILMIVFASSTGCGVKGNPVTLSNIPSNERMVQNLKAVVSDNAVVLKCNYIKESMKSYIAVERSELGSDGNECRDCPRAYERIGEIALKENKNNNQEYGIFNYSDKNVTKGKTYSYRLLLCSDVQDCSESNVAQIKFK